jgi:hypothetical protein
VAAAICGGREYRGAAGNPAEKDGKIHVGRVNQKSRPDLMGVTKNHSPGWLDEQLANPELVYPASIMPAYDLETNAGKALIAFMASATVFNISIRGMPAPEPPA